MSVAILIRTTCTRCGQQKAPADFDASKNAVSGRRSVCKVCKADLARAYAATDTGRAVNVRAKAKYRSTEHGRVHELAHHRAYRQTPAGREAFRRAEKKRDPVKVSARKQVQYAVRSGRLERQPCSVCQALGAHGHHEDYGRPLEVTWLCTGCHARLHREARRAC